MSTEAGTDRAIHAPTPPMSRTEREALYLGDGRLFRIDQRRGRPTIVR